MIGPAPAALGNYPAASIGVLSQNGEIPVKNVTYDASTNVLTIELTQWNQPNGYSSPDMVE